MSPYGNKVKITTKDGKQVDLEKKLGSSTSGTSSASVTPVASPAASAASVHKPAPVPSTPAASTSSGATPPASSSSAPAPASAASSPAKLSIAEEFRRKILERAQAAQKEKELKEKEKEKPETTTNTPVESEPKEPKEVKETVKEDVKEDVKEAKDVTEPVKDSEPVSVKAEVPEVEAPVSEKSATFQVEEPEQVQQISEKAVEEAEQATPAVPVPSALKENVSEDVAAISPAVEKQNEEEEAPETETKGEEKEEAEASNDEGADEDEEGEGEEDAEAEDGLDLSQFFQRLQEVKPIEDPYSMTYPEPFTGVDPKWKSEKAFRYDPQFLIQFKDVVQFPIDEEFKNKLESLGITAGRKAPQGARGGLNRFGAGGARFGPGMGNRGQFSDPRQNSRNGSRRRGGRDRKSVV